MSKKQANLTAIMLVQQLVDEHWLSSDYKEPLKQAKVGNCRPLLDKVIEKLEKDDIIVKEAHIIKHDKDKVFIWDSKKMKNVVENKTEHIHTLLKFEKGASLSKIALAIGVEPQYLEKLKSGRYGYDNCLAYLVHAKDESKYQYQPEEVITVRGEDYTSIYHRSMETWVKGRATKKAKETNLSVDWLISEILSGHLEKSQILLTDEYYKVYGQHKRRINEALDTAMEKKGFQAVLDIEAGHFKKTILFICGASGKGKTLLSKQLIKILKQIALRHSKSWEACSTASTNPFDEYNGEDILFLDDIRGYSLIASDWLKLLDPYNISPISARYKNKLGSAKIIIITSTKKPVEFFEATKGNYNEDLGQFIRRIDYLVEITDTDCHLSVPISNPDIDFGFPWERHSYRFSAVSTLKKNFAINILLKKIIRNMQWNKQKKVINATDQSNKDNPNNQHK